MSDRKYVDVTFILLIFCLFLFSCSSHQTGDGQLDRGGEVISAVDVVAVPVSAEATEEAKVAFSKNDPSLTLEKWNGGAKLNISYDGFAASSSLVDEKATWDSPTQKLESYVLNDSTGAVEVALILKEPPTTNTFSFQIAGAENLDFFYQPPLDEENRIGQKDIVSCNATDCINEKGIVRIHRPEDVVGSYAVYHKNLKDHIEGQTNYATGKAFHIYRPKIIDANGEWTWGTLQYTDSTLTVIVPQKFLDTAIYPVVVDPTFGYTTQGGSEDNSEFFQHSYSNATSQPAGTGTLTSISIYGRSGNGHTLMETTLYSSSGTVPNARLVTNNSGTVATTSSGWNNLTMGGNTTVTAGTQYWFGYRLEFASFDSGNAGEYRFRNVGGDVPMPDPADSSGTLNSGSNRISIYGTYAAAAATSATLWQLNSTNSTTVSSSVLHSVYWNLSNASAANLSGYIFGWCNGSYSATLSDLSPTTNATVWSGNFSTPGNAGVSDNARATGVANAREIYNFTIDNLPTTAVITAINLDTEASASSATGTNELFVGVGNGTTWSAYNTTGDISTTDVETPMYNDLWGLSWSVNSTGSLLILVNDTSGATSTRTMRIDYQRLTVNYTYLSAGNCTDSNPYFTNDSFVAMTGSGNWSNITKTINSAVGSTVKWYVWANNSLGTTNQTSTFSYVTTAAASGGGLNCSIQNVSGIDYWPCGCNINASITSTGSTKLVFNGTGSQSWNATISGYKVVSFPSCVVRASNLSRII